MPTVKFVPPKTMFRWALWYGGGPKEVTVVGETDKFYRIRENGNERNTLKAGNRPLFATREECIAFRRAELNTEASTAEEVLEAAKAAVIVFNEKYPLPLDISGG